MQLIQFVDNDYNHLDSQLDKYIDLLKSNNVNNKDIEFGMIISGYVLFRFNFENIKLKIFKLIELCKFVMCCRVNP